VSETAAAQLRRILHLIPLCEDDAAHPLDGMAVALGTDTRTLLRDLRALSERFDDPGGFVEGVQVFVEPGRFSLRSDHFRRPMRLTLAELGALELGLAILEAERPPDEQDAIRRARRRLEQVLVAEPDDEPGDVLRHAEQGADADPEILRTVREGVRQARRLTIRYASAGVVEATERTVAPLSLLPNRGRWFLVALSGEDVRVYRLDRMEEARLLEESFERPVGRALEELVVNGRVFIGETTERLVVRYSSRIAPWIMEREGKERDVDGSVTVEYPLGDAEWAVGHVLQYGPDAEVLGPVRVRDLVRGRLREILQAPTEPPSAASRPDSRS
jgi:predicted DNA-binding transcriptional regulator YafY